MHIVQLDREWSSQLKQVPVIFQVEYLAEDAKAAMLRIGSLVKASRFDLIQRDYSACLLIGINYVASAKYERGALWPEIFDALGELNDKQATATKLSAIYQDALDAFELERFEHPLSNIGEMLLHSGITITSLAKLMKPLLSRYRSEPNLSGESFNQWVRELQLEEVPGKGLDKPSYRFVCQAGAIADDFVDKLIEIIDDMRDGTYDENGGVGLPSRVIEEAVRLIGEDQAKKRLTRAKGTSKVSGKPRFRWDSFFTDNELHLELPDLESQVNTKVAWRLESNYAFEPLVTYPRLPGASDIRNYFRIHKPSASFTLAGLYEQHGDNGNETVLWNTALYNDETLLLFFDDEGYLVTGPSSLSPGIYTVLYPAFLGGMQCQLRFEGAEQIQQTEIEAPNGWAKSEAELGWKAQKVDLSDVARVILVSETAGEQKNVSKRYVSNLRQPKFELASVLLAGIFTEDNLAVLNNLPTVQLPAGGADTATWTVTLRDSERTLIWTHELPPNSAKQSIPLSELCSLFLDGVYDLRVSAAALGWYASAKIAVVNGLESVISPSARALISDGSGLESADFTLEREATVVRGSLDRGAKTAIVRNHEVAKLPLVVRPEYEAYELFNRLSGNRSEWITPAVCHIEDLPFLEFLFKGIAESNVDLVARWPGSDEVHQLRNTATSRRHRFNLAELTTEATQRGAFTATVLRPGLASLTVLNSFNKQLHTSYDYDPQSQELIVQFRGGSVPENLDVCIFSRYAPWVSPVRQAVTEQSIKIGTAISSFGDFYVSLAVSLPHAPHDFGSRPKHDSNTFLVTCEISKQADNPELALATWLKTGVNDSTSINRIPAHVAWMCIIEESIFSGHVKREAIRNLGAEVLAADQQKAIDSYPVDHPEAHKYLKHFYLADLFDAAPSAAPGRLDSTMRKPFLAALKIGVPNTDDRLESFIALTESAWGFSSPKLTELREESSARAYAQKLLILKSENLSYFLVHRAAGREFVIESPFVSDERKLEDYIVEKQLPPGLFYSPGTLAQIYYSMIQGQMQIIESLKVDDLKKLVEFFQDSDQKLPDSYQSLAKSRPFLNPDTVIAEGAAQWMLYVPALSIRLALLARLSARGEPTSKEFWNRLKFYYKRFNMVVEPLVEHDLSTAEIYLSTGESTK